MSDLLERAYEFLGEVAIPGKGRGNPMRRMPGEVLVAKRKHFQDKIVRADARMGKLGRERDQFFSRPAWGEPDRWVSPSERSTVNHRLGKLASKRDAMKRSQAQHRDNLAQLPHTPHAPHSSGRNKKRGYIGPSVKELKARRRRK